MPIKKAVSSIMLAGIVLVAGEATAHSSTHSSGIQHHPHSFLYQHGHYSPRRQSHSYGYQPLRHNHYRPSRNDSCYTKPRYRGKQLHRHSKLKRRRHD